MNSHEVGNWLTGLAWSGLSDLAGLASRKMRHQSGIGLHWLPESDGSAETVFYLAVQCTRIGHALHDAQQLTSRWRVITVTATADE